MKKLTVLAAVCLVPGLAFAAPLKTDQQKLSYTLGVGLGKNLKLQAENLDLTSFINGLMDSYQGKKLQLSDAKMAAIAQQCQQARIAKVQQKVAKIAQANARVAKAFLAANAKKAGVKVLPDGLQYKIIKPGTGAKPTADSIVTVNYEGKLINGNVFDSSYRRGKPAVFPVSVVIPGWQQALKLMKTGATWMLYIPPQLAYKAQGVPGSIGPNEALIFKVQLLSVK